MGTGDRASSRRSRPLSPDPDVTPSASFVSAPSYPQLPSQPQAPTPAHIRQSDTENEEDFEILSPEELDFEDDVSVLGLVPSATMAAEFTEGRLETTVDSPQKELPGTKDAYVSYQVTTRVCALPGPCRVLALPAANSPCAVRLPIVPTPRILSAAPLYRLRLPLETIDQRVPTMRNTASPR